MSITLAYRVAFDENIYQMDTIHKKEKIDGKKVSCRWLDDK